jgi:hypothetical protein
MDYNIRRPGVFLRPNHQSSNTVLIFVALMVVLLVSGGLFAGSRQFQGDAVSPGEAQGISGGPQILAVGPASRQ